MVSQQSYMSPVLHQLMCTHCGLSMGVQDRAAASEVYSLGQLLRINLRSSITFLHLARYFSMRLLSSLKTFSQQALPLLVSNDLGLQAVPKPQWTV